MSAKIPGQTGEVSTLFWSIYNLELVGDGIISDFKSIGSLPELNYNDVSAAQFTFSDPADIIDIVQIDLTQGVTYDIFAVGEVSVNLFSIMDSNGWALISTDGDDGISAGFDSDFANSFASSSGLYTYSYADSMVGFEASYSGVHYIVIEPIHLFGGDMFFVVAARGSETEDPFIEHRDEYNWDNNIIDERGAIISASDAQLYRTYMGAMGRIPDLNGFKWWAAEIESGRHNLDSMASGFINSDEFVGYADTNFDNYISNHEFVTHMYEGVFGREPDQGGYNYWMGELEEGISQAKVLTEMTQSNEYIDLSLNTVADFLFL